MEWLDVFNQFEGSDVGLGIAFLAGVLAFFSPCILPVIPGYVGYFTGVGLGGIIKNQGKRRRFYQQIVFIHSLWFVAGFLIVFGLLGLASGALGSFLAIYKTTLQRVGGVVLIGLGLYVMELFKIPSLYGQARFSAPKWLNRPGWKKMRWLNSFIVGITFGLAWTPCIGPVLATILFLATFAGGSTEGFFLLFMFALGLGVPFIIVALGIQRFLPFIQRAGKYMRIIQKVAGAFIVVLGILLLTNLFNSVLSYFIQLSNPVL